MELKITGKQYARNEKYKTNTVYFEIDNSPLELHIIYLSLGGKEKLVKSGEGIYLGIEPKRRLNAFLVDYLYEKVKEFVTSKYDIEWDEFTNYFMYKLYKYSRGVGLDKDQLNITQDIIDKIEKIKSIGEV